MVHATAPKLSLSESGPRRILDQEDLRGLMTEVEGAEVYRDKFLVKHLENLASIVGQSYFADLTTGEVLPDNRFFEFISRMVPSIAFQPPTWEVSTSLPFLQGDVALAIEVGLDQWTLDEKLIESVRRIVFDMLITWGVARVAARPEGAQADMPAVLNGVPTGVAWRPMVERVDPRNHFRDPRATWFGNARYEGHRWAIDKDQLIALAESDDSWNMRAIEALATGNGSDRVERPGGDLKRNEIILTDLFSREFQAEGDPEMGETGGIVTLAHSGHYEKDQEPLPLREVQPWIGHSMGPYVTFGVYDVPNHANPLGPITQSEESVRALNRQTRAIIESDENYANFVATSSSKIAALMTDGKHHHVYQDPDLADADAFMQSFEKGGSSSQQHAQREFASAVADRALGLSDAVRGNVTGAASASENLIAAEAGGLSIDWLRQKTSEAVSRIGERATYQMYHRDDIVFAVADARGKLEGFEENTDRFFTGGGADEILPASFRNLTIKVTEGSMQKPDAGAKQANTIAAINWVSESLPLMTQVGSPEAWVEAAKRVGEAFSVDGLDRLVLAHLTGQADRVPVLASDVAGRGGAGALGASPLRSLSGFQGRPPGGSPAPQPQQAPGLGSAPPALQGVVPGVQKRLGLA